MDSHKP